MEKWGPKMQSAGKSEGEDTRIVKGRHQTLYVYELPQIAEGKTP